MLRFHALRSIQSELRLLQEHGFVAVPKCVAGLCFAKTPADFGINNIAAVDPTNVLL